MFPRLYNRSGQLQAVLDNIIKDTAAIKRVVNGEFTFTFEAFEKELKSEYFNPNYYLLVDNQTFDIKYIEQNHEEEIKYSIQCEHVNYRMADGSGNLFTSYVKTGTPAQILADMLSGTEFSVGTVEFTNAITVSVNGEITRKALIYELVNLVGGEIDYTNNGFTINLLASIGKNNGFQVRFGKNLKGVSKVVDARGGLKTYYSVDLVDLRNCTEYIEKHMQTLETVGVGDTIRIIDQVIGLDVENRVVSIEYNPLFALNTKLEIANTIETITDKITQFETDYVEQDELYNNVAISKEYGFRATRSDKKARATLGGGVISLDKGDGVGGYTPAIFFDASKQKYKVIGDIEMEGGSISWASVNAPTAAQVGARPYNWLPTPTEIGARPNNWMPSASDVGAISSTYIDSRGVFTPEVYATHINTLYGKITTAQIENLIVGGNVSMGPYATISWGNVTGQPFIPDSADDIGALPNSSPKLTYISSTGIYTGTVFATLIMGEEFTALNNIKIGSQTDTSAGKGLYFNNDSHIITGGGTVSMGITTPRGLSLNIGSGYDLSMYSGGLNMVLGDRFTLASWSSNDCTVGNYGSGKLTLKSNSGDMSLDCGGNLNIGTVFTDGIGFFGHSPSPKLSAQRLPSNATLSDIIFKINGLLAKFDQYGLLYVYD